MATTDNTTPALPAGFDLASAVQPTINFISQQIRASLPSQYADAITAQFAGASTNGASTNGASSTGGGAPPAALPTFSNAQEASAAFGAALARPSIEFIQAQITSLVPSEYAAAITAQFAATPPFFAQGAAVPPTSGASAQVQVIPAGLREYLLGPNTPAL